MLSVDLIGLAEAEAKIKSLGLLGQQRVRDVINEAALNIQREARRKCPVNFGRLRASIRPTFYEAGLAAEIGTDVQYAPYVEFGTRPGHFPPPGALLEWMRKKGIPPEAELAIRRKIAARGVQPHPFLFPAYEEEIPRYLDHLRAAIRGLPAEAGS